MCEVDVGCVRLWWFRVRSSSLIQSAYLLDFLCVGWQCQDSVFSWSGSNIIFLPLLIPAWFLYAFGPLYHSSIILSSLFFVICLLCNCSHSTHPHCLPSHSLPVLPLSCSFIIFWLIIFLLGLLIRLPFFFVFCTSSFSTYVYFFSTYSFSLTVSIHPFTFLLFFSCSFPFQFFFLPLVHLSTCPVPFLLFSISFPPPLPLLSSFSLLLFCTCVFMCQDTNIAHLGNS